MAPFSMESRGGVGNSNSGGEHAAAGGMSIAHTPISLKTPTRTPNAARVPPLTPSRASSVVRFGIAGCGKIAGDFARTLVLNVSGVEIAAVASRDGTKAEKFAQTYERNNKNKIASYASYEDLCRDENVDVVYVATIHTTHFQVAKEALSNGKHVLVEKPMGMNSREVNAIFKMARSANLLAVEGLWTRFFPAVKRARNLLHQEQLIGPVSTCMAAFGFATEDGSIPRLYDPALGGGATLDIGMYPLSLVTGALRPTEYAQGDKNQKLSATGVKSSSTGVDTSAHISMAIGFERAPPLSYAAGDDSSGDEDNAMEQRTLHCTASYAIREQLPETSTYCGRKGHLIVEEPAHAPTKLTYTLHSDGLRRVEHFNMPREPDNTLPDYNYRNSQGFMYEIAAVRDAITKGRTECEDWTTAEALWMARTLDTVRHSLGVRYEADNAVTSEKRAKVFTWLAKLAVASAGAVMGVRLSQRKGTTISAASANDAVAASSKTTKKANLPPWSRGGT